MIKHFLAAIAVMCSSSSAFALDLNQLEAITKTVTTICVTPDRAGSLVKAEGEAKFGLPIFVKIVDANLSGKLNYENWKGIPITADKYSTDPRKCAVEILKILAPVTGPLVPSDNRAISSDNRTTTSDDRKPEDLCGSMIIADLQKQTGYDGTPYDTYYDFTKGKEKVDGRACGREVWITRDKTHPLFGDKFVYLVDGQKNRMTEQVYIENSDGTLRLAPRS